MHLMLWALAIGAAQNPLNIPMPSDEDVRRCTPPGVRDDTPMSAISRAQLVAAMACLQSLIARQINSVVPIRVDEATTLVSATAIGLTLQYNYRVDLDAAEVTAAQRSSLAQATRAFACGRADMRQVIARGGSYRYVWNDRAGRLLHQVLVERCA